MVLKEADINFQLLRSSVYLNTVNKPIVKTILTSQPGYILNSYL